VIAWGRKRVLGRAVDSLTESREGQSEGTLGALGGSAKHESLVDVAKAMDLSFG